MPADVTLSRSGGLGWVGFGGLVRAFAVSHCPSALSGYYVRLMPLVFDALFTALLAALLLITRMIAFFASYDWNIAMASIWF